ncbi:hypothetical protein BGZ94_009178 [Podila epigama]|nr:hypothetical protein BGZ94_009178 [Podila epigama]
MGTKVEHTTDPFRSQEYPQQQLQQQQRQQQQQQQQRQASIQNHHHGHGHHHHRNRGAAIVVTPEFQKHSEDTLREILQRLAYRQHEMNTRPMYTLAHQTSTMSLSTIATSH